MTEGREALTELSAIRERLRRADTTRILATGGKQPVSELLERMIHNRPTAIARSEIPAPSEDVQSLKDKVTTIRRWLLEHGKWIEEDGKKYFSHETGIFHAAADDLNRTNHPTPSQLLLIIDEAEQEITIHFGFNNDFQLEIFFTDNDDPTRYAQRYDSARRPLEEMTKEEARIITYYIDLYGSTCQIN